MLVPLLTLILSSLLPLGIALATRFTADSHLVAIAAATLRRALATRAIAGSPSSLSPLPLSLGMFLARAIVDPHIILLSLLSPWLVLATRATGVSHFGAIAGTSSCTSSPAFYRGDPLRRCFVLIVPAMESPHRHHYRCCQIWCFLLLVSQLTIVLSPLPLPPGMFLARAIVDPHLVSIAPTLDVSCHCAVVDLHLVIIDAMTFVCCCCSCHS